jgi:hypothetical protein
MTTTLRPLVLILAAATLAACGDTQTERGVTGAAIGAGAGAVGSAALGGSVVGGALIGGAAGAATGVLTDRDDLDLGDVPDL